MAYKTREQANAYMREWRKTHALNPESKRRDISRSIAGVYLRRRKIKQCKCQVCGSNDSEMHHPDHELPLFVIWLCRPCHLAWHEHWRETIFKVFAEWLEIAKQIAAIRKAA